MRLKIWIAKDWLHWVGRCVGGKVYMNHKSLQWIKISELVQDLFDIQWFDMTPPNHSPINKSSNKFELTHLVQELLHFSDLTPPGVG